MGIFSRLSSSIEMLRLSKTITNSIVEDVCQLMVRDGFPEDKRHVKNQILTLKQHIRRNIPLEDVVEEALQIYHPKALSTRVSFWECIMLLYMTTQMDFLGNGTVALVLDARSSPISAIHGDRARELIPKDAPIYALNANLQMDYFLFYTQNVGMEDGLSKKVIHALLDNTDVRYMEAVKAKEGGRLLEAWRQLKVVRERLEEPDEEVENLWKELEDEKSRDPEGFESTGSLRRPILNMSQKIGRNDPCPCGSGKKYKNCCGRLNGGTTQPV